MKLLNIKDLEKYINNNKKEAEKEFPEIIKKLINNTVKNITHIDIPSGNHIMQTGFDGVVEFTGENKYLGNKRCNIEIGTSNVYLEKANEDIEKRVPNSNENFVFITPFCWNSRIMPKSKWISQKKEKYCWNDIKIIDGELLEEWLGEDFLTSKYLLNKFGQDIDNIQMINEVENELKLKTIKEMGLDFFNYENKEYEDFLSNLSKEYYHIKAISKEEGLYVTLFYLNKLNKTSETIVVNDINTWNTIIRNKIIKNSILIPNFTIEDIPIPHNNITIIIHSIEEIVNNYDFEILSRTRNNLHGCLEKYYLDKDGNKDYNTINSIINKSLNKYIPLKREIFKTSTKPSWYLDSQKDENFIFLFLLNQFHQKDLKILKEININITDIKKNIAILLKKEDPYIIYYKYYDEYRVVNIYDNIEYIGDLIEEDIIDKFCILLRIIFKYKSPRYFENNIDELYIRDISKEEYSETLKEGLIKSLVILKKYLYRNNKYNLVNKLNDVVIEYYDSITTEEDYLNFSDIATTLSEYDFELYLNKIKNSINNKSFTKMFYYNGNLFARNNYCNVLWGVEKALQKRETIEDAIETLVHLSKIKDASYNNMVNKPIYSLTRVFMGYQNITSLTKDEKIEILNKIIKNNFELGRTLLIELMPDSHFSYTDFIPLEFDEPDETIPIIYINEMYPYFDAYFNIYINNYCNKYSDLKFLFEEVNYLSQEIIENIKKKILFFNNNDDEDMYILKEKISSRIRGCERYQNDAWYIDSKIKEQLEEILSLLKYNNPIYDYIYLYEHYYNKNEVSSTREKVLELIKENYKNRIILLEHVENIHLYISDLYTYIDNGIPNLEFLKELFIKGEYYEIYIRNIYSNITMKRIIEIYEDKIFNDIDTNKKIIILNNQGFYEEIYEFVKINNLEKIYWETFRGYNTANNFVYEKLFEYKHYDECLEIISDFPDKYEEKCLILEKIIEEKYTLSNNPLSKYYINEIFKSFHKNDNYLEHFRLAKLEIYYANLLNDKYYYLSKEISKHFELAVDLVCNVYKDEQGNYINTDDRESIALNCYKILNAIKIDFSLKTSMKWVDCYIKEIEKNNRKKVGENVLGSLLARSNRNSKDNIFPIENVRKIIEKYYSRELANGFEIEIYNNRGVHYIDKGENEYALYEQYKNWADNLKIKYPKTSKILKEIAENYKNESIELRDKANYVN